jgi:hypothetical protein
MSTQVSRSWWIGTFSPSDSPDTQWDLEHVEEIDYELFARAQEASNALRAFANPEHLILLAKNWEGFRNALQNLTKVFLRRTVPPDLHEQANRQLRTWLFNWLLSFRAYLDHTQRRLTKRYGKNSAQLKAFKDATAAEFDGHWSYRFMYKLRDYAQHCDFPSLDLSVREKNPKPGTLNIEVALEFDRDELLGSWDDWTPHVEPELQAQPEKFPAAAHLDVVMDCMDRIEMVVERVEDTFIQTQRDLIGEVVGKAQTKSGTPLLFEQRMKDDRIEGMTFVNIPDWLITAAESD